MRLSMASPSSALSAHDDSSTTLSSSDTTTSPRTPRDHAPRDVIAARDASASANDAMTSSSNDCDPWKSMSTVASGSAEVGGDEGRGVAYYCMFCTESYKKKKHLHQHEQVLKGKHFLYIFLHRRCAVFLKCSEAYEH